MAATSPAAAAAAASRNAEARPRTTPYRCVLRLRDRLELFLERYVDGDPTAPAEFGIYKTDRDRRWAEKDAGRKMSKAPAAAMAISIINGPADETPVGGPITAHPGADAADHSDDAGGQNITRARGRERGKGKGNETAVRPADGGAETERPPRAAGGSAAGRQVGAPRPRKMLRSSTLSSLIDSAIGEKRRRRRKRSDARPGYFDPGPSPPTPSRSAALTGVGVGVGTGAGADEDRLEMNVPVELARRSWTVPIGTAM
ncbi:hypothetical protein CH63R_09345 [Colletotrichum higginsianum IMI 349063]|uniref:Uncharacterized protein n=1 Tax=Colletotrichum higginsianum (strain IMI 349063) TaxID=759273 RepID=A0A1B7Y765_COLHI|nr:hypothetical protein CH63R_09345 [Colletotrichum higginsianum IMI 349063]OBR07824.1 hypothetical protein CH63R_09345 [Colletotrichum higginsianum IMI 349063]